MISDAIIKLMRPLEDFEALRRKAVRFGSRLCDLSYANPYEGAHEPAVAALGRALADQRALGLQYSPFGGQTLARRRVADALRDSHNLDMTFRDVVLTPGAMSALHVALLSCLEPGAEVIVPTPCWLDYHIYVLHLGGRPVSVPFAREAEPLDIAAIAGAVTPRTRAVLLSHPSNPMGHSYDPDTLRALGEALSERAKALDIPITLIADETHRDFTDPGTYKSFAQHYDATLIVYSFGKYHFMQGQRLGYCAVSPRHPERARLQDEMVRWTRITGIATPTAVMQRALPELLELRYDQAWLNAWRRSFVERLSAAGYRLVNPDSTLFIYVRVPDDNEEGGFVARLAERGVLVLPAEVFHHSGYFRLALTGSEAMLDGALAVLEEMGKG